MARTAPPARSRRASLLQVIAAFVVGGALTCAVMCLNTGATEPVARENTPQARTAAPLCDQHLLRARGYAGVEPLIASERPCESPGLAGLKAAIDSKVAAYRAADSATDVSVYIRVFGQGDWTCFNDSARFEAGDLLDLPVAITYLRAAQDDHATLEARYAIEGAVPAPMRLLSAPKEPLAGRPYTVDELLRHMIVGCDRQAAEVLHEHIDQRMFQRVLQDLDLPGIDLKAAAHPIGARDYAMYLRTLFNASYLGISTSERAVGLLTERPFTEGILAGLPNGLRVAHMFSERSQNGEEHVHEAAIVYAGDRTYLLTVFTKGKDVGRLKGVLRGISSLVYRSLIAPA